MSREPQNIAVDIGRLRADIEALGQIGRDPRGGVSRPSFSPADLEARAWLKNKIEESGLHCRRDGAGNIFGVLGGDGPVVLAGSHIDTVINGGRFDGAAGVLAALECLRRIREENLRLAKPVGLVSFTDEEGNLVGDFLGSRAFTGRLNPQEVERGLTSSGPLLRDILAGAGLSVDSVLRAHRDRPGVDAYLELHIEQGPKLEADGASIGIVGRIAGKNYRWCSYLGKADHGGTTPLELRRDAFLAAADFALQGTRLVAARHRDGLMTIGRISLTPGSFSVVPGQADFSLDIRSASAETLRGMGRELLALAEEVAATRGLEFRTRLADETEPVTMSARLIEVLKEGCAELGYRYLTLTSGAGHDAQIVSAIADAGMIFIPCAGGVSHAPEEMIDWDDLEKGANLLLRSLIRLASRES
ncbi:MAG: Zn-dependent hydrolase [Candidatus Aminicenantes bacterium RBG_16_63_16]|nr:MAG: Zn-dependent hydrolase [Candidatus Aminicenantes bacterium RBG_16_63_16]